MSTAKSSGGDKKPPKNKSKGFIESSDFKPGWLETGPLPADVLPEPPDPAAAPSMAEELAALQQALDKLYGTGDTDTNTPDADTLDTDAAEVGEIAPGSTPEAAIHPETTGPTPLAPPPQVTAATPPPATLPVESIVPPAIAPEPVALEPVAPEPVAAPPEPIAWSGETIELAATEEPPAAPLDAETTAATGPATVEPALPEIEWATIEEPEAGQPDIWEEQWDLPEFAAPLPVETAVLTPEEEAPVVAVGEPAAPEAKTPRRARRARQPRQPRQSRPPRRRSRLSVALLALSLLLLAAAAIVYFVNPFVRLALGMASLARPISSPGLNPPSGADGGDWCLQGTFPTGDSLPQLRDDGSQGDVLAEDDVFTLEFPILQPGTYRWQVVNCDDDSRVFPAAPAWIITQEPNQPVTFVFDSNERADRLFFPIPYAVSALDGVENYHVVGSFQEWIANDASGRLDPLGGGIYQQVRRIARSGNYQSYVIAGDPEQAIDAYGRTTEPIPFAFSTDRNGEYVVFLVDIDRGRASVMYDMPPLVTRLAFGGGHQTLSLVLGGLAGLLLLLLLLREMMLRSRRLRMETGCPRCHEQELMRISRRPRDRLLHMLGIPAYRYRCRNCTWEGTRLSEAGRSVSPGATIAHIEGLR